MYPNGDVCWLQNSSVKYYSRQTLRIFSQEQKLFDPNEQNFSKYEWIGSVDFESYEGQMMNFMKHGKGEKLIWMIKN